MLDNTDPNAPDFARNLSQALAWSRRQLEPYREKRIERIKSYVGTDYSDTGSDKNIPINLLYLAVKVYCRQLVGQQPRVLVTTFHDALKSRAADVELEMNNLLKELRIHRTLDRMVRDAMFSVGIVKHGISRGVPIQTQWNTYIDPGLEFVDNVGLDDFVVDMSATTFERATFMGDKYPVPYDELREQLPQDRLDQITHTSMMETTNEHGDDRAETVGVGQTASHTARWQPVVWLWDIYLPRQNVVVTCQHQQGESGAKVSEPLRVVDYEGPESGPYTILSFDDVPGNIMPLAPTAVLFKLHEACNRVWRKLYRQADRQKTNLLVDGRAENDAGRIVSANDGEAIRVDHPDGMHEVRYGGPDQPNFAFMLNSKDLFSYLAGNLDTLGGLSPQADTLGQEQILAGSSGALLEDMRERTNGAVREIVRALALYRRTDPVREFRGYRSIPGMDEIQVPVLVTPEQRENDFGHYNFDIDPYSMRTQNPAQRLQTVLTGIERVIAPLYPLMQQQGISIDFEQLMKLFSRYTGTPEVTDIITFTGPQTAYEPGPQRTQKPSVTRRQYERINRPGGTRSQQDNALMRQLLGENLQAAESSSIGRGSR